jgi:NAD(P)H dehydrogenase (quinone)
MADILIIFHSQTGNTEKLARAVAQGVDGTTNARAVLKRAAHTVAQDLKDCSAVVMTRPCTRSLSVSLSAQVTMDHLH